MVKSTIILILSIFLISCVSTKWTRMIKNKSDSVVRIKREFKERNLKTNKIENFVKVSTGFIIDKNIIVTAAHVVKKIKEEKNTGKSYILLKNNNKLEIEKIYCNYNNDVAIIITKNMKDYNKFKIRENFPKTGEDILVIGNTSSFGEYFSNKGSIIKIQENYLLNSKKINMIYTSARLDRGNSGSPVLDATGKVIGIVSKVFWNDKGYYASIIIPIKYIDKLIQKYKNDKDK